MGNWIVEIGASATRDRQRIRRRRSTLQNLALCGLLAAPTLSAAATLPPGFAEGPIASGLSQPTAMALAPDGRLFVCEQSGSLRVIKQGVLLPTPFTTLPVDSNGERGLLGVALDPNFATNGYVYVYYTTNSAPIHNRISRFTAAGDVAAGGSEVVILELDPLSTATNHNGGAMHFGPDGKLYAAVGENANGSNAQTLNNLLGKMLRINSDGTIPPDNPFFGVASGKNRAIWALGLRNPFSFAFQPGTGRMLINDVGQGTWEEIDDGIAGSNYGWPQTEGPEPPGVAGVRYPIYSYSHGPACAIVGGAFYNPSTLSFPTSYAGDYFFADLCAGWIRRLDLATLTAATFATGVSTPVDLKVTSDGSLSYLARGDGSVYRVRYPSTVTLGVYRPSGGAWYLRNSNSGGTPSIAASYGAAPSDLPVIGDWDGDGVDTIGVFRPSGGAWYLSNSNTGGPPAIALSYGIPGDTAVAGDWDGDGVDTIGIFRSSGGAWYLRDSNTEGSPDIVLSYGVPGDIPVVGDWDGDGVDTIGVFRPSGGAWFLRNSNSQGPPDIVLFFGILGDIPVVGDWDGDGVDTIGVYRPSQGVWFLRNAEGQGPPDVPAAFYGTSIDMPVTGNWDGLPTP